MARPLRSSELRVALLAGDAFVLAAAVTIALWTWSLTAGFPFDLSFLRARVIWYACVPIWLFLLAPTRRTGIALDPVETTKGIVVAALALLLVYLGAFFFAAGARLPRLIALYILWDGTLLLAGWRLVAQWSLVQAPFSRRVLIAGSGPALEAARELLRRPEFRDVQIVGTVDGAESIDDADNHGGITDVVVATQGAVGDHGMKQLLKCRERGIHVVRMSQLYEETLGRVPVGHVESTWLLTSFLDVARFRDASPLAKRAFDLVVGCALALVGLALLPFIALAVLVDSGSPVFYRQQRAGRGGRPFTLAKFRTMRRDAEKDGAARWSVVDDPRVTRTGRFLRRTRLDELPNVVAVLRGDMSIVGPRPERPEFIDQLEREVPFYRARLIVQPGLTGWAQVNMPYGDSVGDASVKLEYDLYYIKHQSVWFDALIVLRTVGTILRLAGR